MSVIGANEVRESPSGSKDLQLVRTYTRTWDVYCSSLNDGPKTVISYAPLPKVGDTYGFGTENDTGALCSSVSAERKQIVKDASGTQYIWTFKADYKTPEKNQSGEDPDKIENPLLRPVRIRGGGQQFSKLTQKDKDDNAIDNSAEELFPPAEIEDARFEVEFVKNQATSPASYCLAYINRVNADAIWGGDVGTWKCQDISYQKVFEGDYTYYEVTYRFQYDPKTFKLKLVDNGFNELVGGVLKPILVNNMRTPDPVKLNGSGEKAAAGADPVILEFDVYDSVNFASLGLPGSL